MSKPNFIVIGAARCATTSLHKYLQNHPDIFLSDPKEINYFSKDRFYTKGEKWYLAHFDEAKTKAIGEASTSYTSAPNIENAPLRIKTDLGSDIKFIYIVRDPIERMLSHYTHYIMRGQKIESLDRIIEDKTHSIVVQGKYAYQLSLYLAHFDKENFKVITVEQLKKKPVNTMESLYHFLEIAPNATFDNEVHNNNTEFKEMTHFGKALMQFYNHHFEHLAPPSIVKRTLEKLARLGGDTFQKPKLTEEQIIELRQFYKDDMIKFKEDWGIDLYSRWNVNK